ncbi:hypothetical protein BD626DRAFT_555847 [Schizophyllum amplum]|uniref:ARID domain-containing protein n=1 Tax=Schizophyllum amplum TaxID=97359 RepID=A0A550CLW2_9AGAR|nr:hypothetical protein BD626DRAFT_555847 [Auriculariopsis ampla]
MLPHQSPGGFSGDGAYFGTMDAAQAKQMAALSAAGQLRHASTRSFAGVGGTNSAAYGSPGPSAAHDPLSSSSTVNPLQPPSAMQAAGFTPEALAAAQGNPALARQMIAAQNLKRFLMTLAHFHHQRGTPLPPQLTGIPTPSYNPQNTIWKQVELSHTDHGAFRIGGRDINLFKLYQVVTNAGGFALITTQNLWPRVCKMLDLPLEIPGSSTTAAVILKQYFNGVLFPFEEFQRANKQAQAAQPPQPPPIDPMSAIGGVQPQDEFLGMGMGPSASRAHAGTSLPPPTPHMASTPSLEPPPVDNMMDNGALVDNGLKRKLELEEAEMKRSRQKTEPSESSSNPPSVPPPSGSAQAGPRVRGRRKIEYVPIAREIDTYGGRDLALIEKQADEARRKQIRDFSDWGTVDVDHLILSIRSRVATELSYALTTLNILSAMRLGAPNSGFQINACPDLVDELLDLLEDSAFDGAPETAEDTSGDDFTHRQLMKHVYDEEDQPFAVLKPKQGGKLTSSKGPTPPPAHIIQIWRFLASRPRLLDCILRVCSLKRGADGAPRAVSPALSIPDMINMRKDALYMLSNLAPNTRFAKNPADPPKPASAERGSSFNYWHTSSSTSRNPYRLYSTASYSRPRPSSLKPFGLTDIALEALTAVAQPDSNRQVLAKALPVPARLARDRALAVRSVLMRLVHRLMITSGSQDVRQWNSAPVRRAIETLKVLEDAADPFVVAEDTAAPVLAFGMGFGQGGEGSDEHGHGLLAAYREQGLDVLLTAPVNTDSVMFNELDSLIRVEV